MSLSSHFKTDANLERKGVGIDMPANDDGSVPCIYIARAGRNNPEYQKVVDRIMKPYRRAAQVGALPQSKQDVLTRECFAEAGILGWKNVLKSDVTGNDGGTNADGSLRPLDEGFADYTKDNAIALLTRLPDLYTSLIELSVDRSTFLEVEREADAKNSAKSSPTNLSTAAPNGQ